MLAALRELDLPVARGVVVLDRYRSQVNLAPAVDHHSRDLLVQVIQLLGGSLQPFLELRGHKVALRSPSLEALRYESVGKAVELVV